MTGRKSYTSQRTGKAVSRQANYFTKWSNEMEYTAHPDKVVTLARGKFRGYPFIVLSMGTHPVAYVCLPEGHRLMGVDYAEVNSSDELHVHGGLTFSGAQVRRSTIKDRWWLGWDYAHIGIGDYVPIWEDAAARRYGATKKWTREEIVAEVKDVIIQLDNIK